MSPSPHTLSLFLPISHFNPFLSQLFSISFDICQLFNPHFFIIPHLNFEEPESSRGGFILFFFSFGTTYQVVATRCMMKPFIISCSNEIKFSPLMNYWDQFCNLPDPYQASWNQNVMTIFLVDFKSQSRHKQGLIHGKRCSETPL